MNEWDKIVANNGLECRSCGAWIPLGEKHTCCKITLDTKNAEEMINNTITIKQEFGIDLLPYKCEKVDKVTIYPRVYFDKE